MAITKTIRTTDTKNTNTELSRSALDKFSMNATALALDSKITNYERITLIENLNDEIGAGIEVLKTIRTTAVNSSNPKFAQVLNSIADEIERGRTFTDAINLFPKAFPEYLRAMLAAAEETGNWTTSTENGVEKPGILSLILTQLKRDEKVASKIKTAMMYPSFILGVIALALVLITFLVLPKMRDFFSALDMEKNLNFASKLLLAMGDFIANYYYSIPIAIAAFVLAAIFFWRTLGKTLWYKHCFDIPYLVGKTIKKITLAETLALLSTLISAAIPATKALQIIVTATVNPFVKAGLEKSYTNIQNGKDFSESIRDAHPIFEKEAFQVLSSAQATGQLDQRPLNYAQNLFAKAEEEIDGLIAIIPSILLVCVGCLVGFVAVAFYGSFFGAIGQLSNR